MSDSLEPLGQMSNEQLLGFLGMKEVVIESFKYLGHTPEEIRDILIEMAEEKNSTYY